MQERQHNNRKPLPQVHMVSDRSVTSYPSRYHQTIRERLGPELVGKQIEYPRLAMQDEEYLTADECEELSRALREDSAALPSGLEQQNLLKLANSYGALAQLKRWVFRKAN